MVRRVSALAWLTILFALAAAEPSQPLPRWGRAEFDSCASPGTWEQLADRESRGERPFFGSGGLGALEDLPRFAVWLCEDDHPCAPESANNTAFCFVFDETNNVFIPWGADADLEVWHRPPPPPCDLACLLERKPVHSAYYGSEYDSSNGRLPDVSGNDRHAQVKNSQYYNWRTTVEVRAGHGAKADVVFMHGEKNVHVEWPQNSIPETFTVCSVTRWAKPDPVYQQRILNCQTGPQSGHNWLQGHHACTVDGCFGRGQVYYKDGHRTSGESTSDAYIALAGDDRLDWLVMCGTNNASIAAPGNIVFDQTEVGSASGGSGSCQLNINGYLSQQSEFGLYSVLIWDRGLTTDEMKLVTKGLRNDLMGVGERTTGCTFFNACNQYTALDKLNTVLAAHPPHSVYYGSQYDGEATLPDLSGNNRHAQVTGKKPRVFTGTGNGAQGEVAQLMGSHLSAVLWPENSIPVDYTICSVTRWTGWELDASETYNRRILTCQRDDGGAGSNGWTHGHHAPYQGSSGWWGGRGSHYAGQWNAETTNMNSASVRSSYNSWILDRGPERSDTWYGTGRSDWLVMCASLGDGGPQAPHNILHDWWAVGAHTHKTLTPGRMNINYYSQQSSKWALHAVYIWDKALSTADMRHVARALRNDLMGTAFPSICAVKDCTGQTSSAVYGRLSPAERSRPSAAVESFMQQHPPHSAYYGGQYDVDTNVLPDVSGNGRHATLRDETTAPEVTESVGHMSNRRLATLTGTKDTVIEFPDGSIPAEFTVCSATRYNGEAKRRILECSGINWLHGHSPGDRVAMFYGNKYVYKRALSTELLDGAGQDDWLVLCGTNNPNAQHSAVYADVYPDISSAGGQGNCPLTINHSDESDFEFYSLFVWDKFLTTEEMSAFNTAIVEDIGMYYPAMKKLSSA